MAIHCEPHVEQDLGRHPCVPEPTHKVQDEPDERKDGEERDDPAQRSRVAS